MAYYSARADEYDEWFYRLGDYDHGEALNAQWFREVAVVRQALAQLGPVEEALELACGTGNWTGDLARLAKNVTAVDASAEMIARNRRKVPNANVSYLQRDLFEWEPERTYDLVFFGFWLSHVLPEDLQRFLQKVRRAVKPGGQIFMVDSRQQEVAGPKGRSAESVDEHYQLRQLNDGRQFKVVKIYYQPGELEEHFAQAGFDVTAAFTENFFIYAEGSPAPGSDVP